MDVTGDQGLCTTAVSLRDRMHPRSGTHDEVLLAAAMAGPGREAVVWAAA